VATDPAVINADPARAAIEAHRREPVGLRVLRQNRHPEALELFTTAKLNRRSRRAALGRATEPAHAVIEAHRREPVGLRVLWQNRHPEALELFTTAKLNRRSRRAAHLDTTCHSLGNC
jgi:hypothetical protein